MPDVDSRLHSRRWVISILAKYRGDRCFYCRCELTVPTAWSNLATDRTFDHIIPRSKGGGENLRNLCLCCRGCNLAKADRTPGEWLSPIGVGKGVACG